MLLEVAWDETTTKVHLGMPNEECSLMTMHANATLRQGGHDLELSLVIPPAVLASTTANALTTALTARLPFNLGA